MKTALLLAASALALGLAGCTKPPVRTALDCPKTEGELTRTAAAADGLSCQYVTTDGAEVTLRLVKGDANTTLKAIETELLAGRAAPPADAAKAADGKGTKAGDAEATPEGPKTSATAGDTDKKDGVRVEITRDGKTEVVTDGDQTARVNLPGIHISANDADDSANIQIGPLKVEAGDDTATIRMRRDVRLRGEALSREQRGVRAMFIYTGKDLPDGYRFVGYDAGGPKTGPLAVGIVRGKNTDDASEHSIYPDVKKLVRRNGGV